MLIPAFAGVWDVDQSGFDDLADIVVEVCARLRWSQRHTAGLQGLAPTQWSDQLYGRPGSHISLRRFLQLPSAFHRLFWPRFFHACFGWDLVWGDEASALGHHIELPLRAQPSTLKAALPLKDKREDVS